MPAQGNDRESHGWSGKFRIQKGLEKSGKVKEFLQSSENCLFCSRKNDVLYGNIAKGTSPLSFGVILKGKNVLPREQILSFKSNPQFTSDTCSTVEVKSKYNLWICQKSMEKCIKSGKIQGILQRRVNGNLAVHDREEAGELCCLFVAIV